MDLRLKPQDIVVALKLVAQGNAEWTQPELARSLHISASEVNHGLKRLAACHLFNVRARPRPSLSAARGRRSPSPSAA
jgi:predicted transcriptional regulator